MRMNLYRGERAGLRLRQKLVVYLYLGGMIL